MSEVGSGPRRGIRASQRPGTVTASPALFVSVWVMSVGRQSMRLERNAEWVVFEWPNRMRPEPWLRRGEKNRSKVKSGMDAASWGSKDRLSGGEWIFPSGRTRVRLRSMPVHFEAASMRASSMIPVAALVMLGALVWNSQFPRGSMLLVRT